MPGPAPETEAPDGFQVILESVELQDPPVVVAEVREGVPMSAYAHDLILRTPEGVDPRESDVAPLTHALLISEFGLKRAVRLKGADQQPSSGIRLMATTAVVERLRAIIPIVEVESEAA